MTFVMLGVALLIMQYATRRLDVERRYPPWVDLALGVAGVAGVAFAFLGVIGVALESLPV